MSHACEVCETLERRGAPAAKAGGRLRRLLVEERIVRLCQVHAHVAKQHQVDTIAQLRAIFCEPEGKRSLLPRRAPLNRRVFPPRPEGRRRGDGRRAGDVLEPPASTP